MKLFPHSKTHCRRALHALVIILVSIAFHEASAGDSSAAAEALSNSAKNLARMNCGAKIECFTPDGQEASIATADGNNQSAAALIMDDDTLSCPLKEGETTFIITLPSTSLVDRFRFLNENATARGELIISVSNYQLPVASSKWVEVDGRIPITNKRVFNVSMLGVEARYVKLSFHVEHAGRIASLGLYGGETLQRFAKRQGHLAFASKTVATSRRLEDRLNFNFANLYAKTRVVYVSSGSIQAAQRMIDDDNETTFRFDPTDLRPTVIFELAHEERLHRVSARYAMAGGHMEVFLLEKLSAEAGDLGNAKPIALVANRAADKAAVDFEPRGARYVALRWTPEGTGDRSLEVAEVAAFGDVPLAMLQVNEAPELYASSYSGVPVAGGQASPDISSNLGTLAVPPVLPNVSP